MAASKSTKRIKAEVLSFLATSEGQEWKILISRKGFLDGSTHYAEVCVDDKSIKVNPYKPFIECLASFVHEILHILYPRSYEKTIQRWEKAIIEDLSPSEKTSFLQLIFSHKLMSWDE
jgi:hypothetical protein